MTEYLTQELSSLGTNGVARGSTLSSLSKEPSGAEILGNASSEARKAASSNVIAFQEFTVSEKPFSTETVDNRLG